MGRAAAVLTRRRAAALAALAAALGVYYGVSHLLWDASVWWDAAWLAFVLFPAVFAIVLAVLPLWRAQPVQLAAVGAAFVVAAVVFGVADLTGPSSFAKLGATTAAGFLFLAYFESAAWVVLVAGIIPWVDIYSVFWGPTSRIIEDPGAVSALSFAFRIPGESGYASIGIPDLLFFALFLAAAARFGLRPIPTWAAMTASFGATIALAIWLDLVGLPALPGLSLVFFAVNGDLLWRQLRAGRRR